MTYLLDTNILIYLIKNRPPAVAQRVNALPREDLLCMSFVTYAELLKGGEVISSLEATDVVLWNFNDTSAKTGPSRSVIGSMGFGTKRFRPEFVSGYSA